ncbi:MAG: hypothetical protein BJ554DRAFT_1840 [Olpidium bornovanus]|uniref:Uncharacterized protein n=1 Tax=Olpidium bornovanus TaxID=278681 RepID=A0A8H7ZR34_9FUNG|nr:MAG: hypothetical protein BJ554DRAFT_1840 [Olpidium bornovanus]
MHGRPLLANEARGEVKREAVGAAGGVVRRGPLVAARVSDCRAVVFGAAPRRRRRRRRCRRRSHSGPDTTARVERLLPHSTKASPGGNLDDGVHNLRRIDRRVRILSHQRTGTGRNLLRPRAFYGLLAWHRRLRAGRSSCWAAGGQLVVEVPQQGYCAAYRRGGSPNTVLIHRRTASEIPYPISTAKRLKVLRITGLGYGSKGNMYERASFT